MITTHTLSCGLPLIVEQLPGVRSASLCWLLPAGAGADPAELEGLSTLHAELLCRGAGPHDSRAQADAMDALGMVREAEVRSWFMRLTSTVVSDRLLESLPLLVDMVRRPRFDAGSLEPARELALQSLAGLKDNPPERAAMLLGQLHNELPLNRSGMGTVEGLTRITREHIAQGWDERARPVGSILAVAGDVRTEPLCAELDRLLTGWSGAGPVLTMAPNPSRGSFHHESDESNQVQIYLSHQAPPERDPDSPLEQIVSAVLSGGTSSRLFTEVREKRGLCYSVSSSYVTDKDFGRVVGYVGTTPERAQESLSVLLEQLGTLTAGGGGTIERDEFERAKTGYRTRLVFSGESTQARAITLASDQHRLGRPRSLEELQARIAGVTLDQVNAYVARRQMGPTTIVTLGPKDMTRPA